MAEKKYYWLKLKNDFFERKDIKLMEGMENGKDYIIFLLKLKLRSLEDEGLLRVSDTIPYDEKMLSTITDTDIDIVRSAMKVFIEFGLIEIMENRTIYMHCIEKLIGCEGGSAERVRRFRAKNEGFLLPRNAEVTKKKQNGNTEIEKEIDIEQELNNKEPRKVCDNSNFKGTIKNWCNKMVNRYCPDKNKKQCLEWFNEYRKWLDEYLIEKGVIKITELNKFKGSNKYYPIFENHLKNWMEKDEGMPGRIKLFRNDTIDLEKEIKKRGEG